MRLFQFSSFAALFKIDWQRNVMKLQYRKQRESHRMRKVMLFYTDRWRTFFTFLDVFLIFFSDVFTPVTRTGHWNTGSSLSTVIYFYFFFKFPLKIENEKMYYGQWTLGVTNWPGERRRLSASDDGRLQWTSTTVQLTWQHAACDNRPVVVPWKKFLSPSLAAEPIGPWLLWAAPISGPPTFLGDVNVFFLYIAIMTGENVQ